MATGGKQRSTRDERERARVYQARQSFRDGQARRRTRDNLIAGIAGGILILAIVGAQAAYFMAGPGAPEPSPSTSTSPTPTTTPEPSASPAASTDPSATPTPSPTATPAP